MLAKLEFQHIQKQKLTSLKQTTSYGTKIAFMMDTQMGILQWLLSYSNPSTCYDSDQGITFKMGNSISSNQNGWDMVMQGTAHCVKHLKPVATKFTN